MASLLDRSDYPTLASGTYLNQAALGLVGRPATRAMHSFLDDVGRHGSFNMSDQSEVAYFETLRRRGAQILNCDDEALAIVSSASELLGQLPYMIRPRAGANVVCVATDFPAVTRPWIRYAREHDCTLTFVQDESGSSLTERLLDAVSPDTNVLAVGVVQYATGSRVDISQLREATAAIGARLLVDATQAAGAVPVDTAAWGADAVVTSGYKWLGGHGGVALGVLSDELAAQIPPLPGWMGAENPFAFDAQGLDLAPDARRFTQSTMSYVSIAGLAAAIEQLLALETGLVEHARALAHRLDNGAQPLGWTPFRPLQDVEASSHILSLGHPRLEAAAVTSALATQGIVCGDRLGRLRVSLAPYNDSGDVDALLRALASL